jgi:hypothetical protein
MCTNHESDTTPARLEFGSITIYCCPVDYIEVDSNQLNLFINFKIIQNYNNDWRYLFIFLFIYYLFSFAN